MRFSVLLSLVISLSITAADCLVVDEAPQYLRPYVLPNLAGQAVAVGSQIYRFAVTGNSSDGAFTLMTTDAPASSDLGVLPHIHEAHYENFYCSKGRFQVWAEKNGTENGRVLTQGDYGAVPQGTKHTFQINDDDTTMTGVIVPGGFEELFIFLGETYNSSTGTPFVPTTSNNSAGGGSSPGLISTLESFDVYAQLDFNPRRDFMNGSAPANSTWHTGANSLAKDSATPNFIAKNRGPKYLNTQAGYQIVTPLVTQKQSAGNFTMGTITMSKLPANMTAPMKNLTQPVAFQMEEGELKVTVGLETERLIQGDVFFVPSGTPFTYEATRPFTKFLYVGGGAGGLDAELMGKSVSWDFPTYPTTFGYRA